jgi:hypothetical protein
MSVIPCRQDPRLRAEIDRFAEVLKTQAHTLGSHGLDEASFYDSPIFRGAIEKVRGEYSATMRGKREFVQHVLNHVEDRGLIKGWDTAAYWLMLTVRDAIPKQRDLAKAEFATLRLRLLKIAARVIETARTVRLAFAACHPEADLFASLPGALAPLGP